MIFLNISNPIALGLVTVAVGLLIFLGREIKKSVVVAIPLFAFLILLVIHIVQILNVGENTAEYVTGLYRCVAIDFLFILVNFFSYLWVDDVEAKANNIRSIDNSLDWFWKEI